MSTTPSQVVSRYLAEIVSRGRMDLAAALIRPEVIFTSPYTPEPIRDREGLVAMLAGLQAAFPDFFLTEHATVAEGDLVASRWTAGGTHTGAPFAGLPPSGRSFRIEGMSMYRVEDGRIAEGWVSDDTLGMASQLGLVALEPVG